MIEIGVKNEHCLLYDFMNASVDKENLKHGVVIKLWRGIELEYWSFDVPSNSFNQIIGEGQIELYKAMGRIDDD